MPFYHGKTRDGSDMEKVGGFYVSEDGMQWSNMPYPINKLLNKHLKYTGLTIEEAHQAILDGTSKANKRVQKYLLANFKAFTIDL